MDPAGQLARERFLQVPLVRRTRMFRLGLALAAAAGFFALLIVILRYGFGVHLW